MRLYCTARFAGVVDEVVHDRAVHAALEERMALDVVRPDVAIEEDVRDVVVHERALRVLALGMGGIGEALVGGVVRKT
jgi:hypothetical protein